VRDRTYGKIWLKEGKWHLAGEAHLILRAKRVFARAPHFEGGEIVYKNTDEVCRDLEWFMERYPLRISEADRRSIRTAAKRHEDTILRLDEIIDQNYTSKKFKMAVPAREYQKIAADLFLKRGFLLLADDVGSGKTVSSLCALTVPKTLPAVVVTLAGTMPRQWEEMTRRFLPEITTHVVKKGTPYELPKAAGRGPDLVILNYSKLHGWATTLAAYAKTVIFDECQELRRRGSLKYEAAEFLARHTVRALGASATPIFNLGGEIWSIINVLREDVLGTYDEFCREWCTRYTNARNAPALRDPKALGSYLRAEHIMLRRTRKELGRELPPLTKIPQFIASDEKAIESVEGSAAELARIILSQEKIEGWERLQAAERFDQVLRQATGVAKAPYAADFIRLLVENDESVLVFAWHRNVYDILLSKLKDLKPVMYTGSETTAEKQQAKDQFISGESKIMLMSLRAGQGIDGLQHVCSTVVVVELDWSPGVVEQDIGRILRDGQEHPVTAYILVSDKGSDPTVAEKLGLKTAQIEGLRDPHHEILEELQTDAGRIKDLARNYLSKMKKTKVDA
jgi:SNF2 family DNA or RNA helicase